MMAMEQTPKQLRADDGHNFPARPAVKRKSRARGRDRVERCLEILRLLTAGQEWPAKRLSDAFDVTHRTIQRDMELLEQAGLVLRTCRQRPYRYRLAREATWERPQWSLAEIVALLSLAGRVPEGPSGCDRATAYAAIAKLIRLQPESTRQPLEELVSILAAQQPVLQERLCSLPWLGQLIEALIDHRPLRVRTRDHTHPADGEPPVLVPSAIGVRSGQWVISAYKVHGSELVSLDVASVTSLAFDVQEQ
jgi:predicted DNA-binding transcriptional regulator YafY